MVPFNLQLELNSRLVTISVEQLEQLADQEGFMRYQIRTFNERSVICVNMEEELLSSEERIGLGEDEVFSSEEVAVIATAIRQYNSSRQLNFDQLHFDF